MRLFLLPALLLASGAQAAAPIAGRWLTEDGNAVIAVGPCGAVTCGRVARILVPVKGGPATDRNNPDQRLRDRPLDRLEVLSNFTDAGKDWRGRIYDPKSGKSYKSIVSREATGLKVQGCIMMFCQTQHWRAAPAG